MFVRTSNSIGISRITVGWAAMTSYEIRLIATRVRRWAEKYAEENNHYNDLCGMCAIASGELWRELRREGGNPILCLKDDGPGAHVFVECSGYLVDITATQFEENRVVVRRKELAWKQRDWWQPTWKCKFITEFRAHQRKDGWPKEQRVL
jgi:hypothetical protein